MADIIVGSTNSTGRLATGRSNRGLIFTSASAGYFVFATSGVDLAYRKTTDGGQTWGSDVTIRTGTISAFGCWFDAWTPGETGTKIHIWYMDTDTSTVYYQSLDTASDTLGGEVTVAVSATFATGRSVHVSGAKMRGGYLCCSWVGANSGIIAGTYRSTDDGGSWGTRTNVMELASVDLALWFPGNEADNQDGWILFHDASANELTLKVFDDSANTVSESSNIVTVTETIGDETGRWPMSGAIRHSDGHLIVVAFTEFDTTTADGVCYDINGTGSITALTNLTTNIDDIYYPSLFIDQSNDDLYVIVNGKSDGSETMAASTKIYYSKSTDNGSTWGAQQAYSEDTGAFYLQTWAPLSGYRFAAAFLLRTSSDFMTNYTNSLDLTPAATKAMPFFSRPRRIIRR